MVEFLNGARAVFFKDETLETHTFMPPSHFSIWCPRAGPAHCGVWKRAESGSGLYSGFPPAAQMAVSALPATLNARLLAASMGAYRRPNFSKSRDLTGIKKQFFALCLEHHFAYFYVALAYPFILEGSSAWEVCGPCERMLRTGNRVENSMTDLGRVKHGVGAHTGSATWRKRSVAKPWRHCSQAFIDKTQS
jgi:hypothetical protein